ncbi:MAG: DUF1749 domain-containing protein [Gammaproteobacteria bacterium]|nr:DUF1749 domain-containing protein [Gammaproteobacteria bacterium]
MSSFHLVNVWADPDAGPGGFVPMTDSLLWEPDNSRAGHPAPAVVLVHGWGAYPHRREALALGPALADEGFVCLSVCLRRRGMEGQLNAMPDDDLRDLKLAVDFLHARGCRSVLLVGDELGGHSALRYLARHADRRVAGLAWTHPVNAPADWLRDSAGEQATQQVMADAGIAARQGAGMDQRIDIFPADGPAVTQNALAFLAWWSPATAMSLQRNLEDLRVPLRVFGAAQSVPEALQSYAVRDDADAHTLAAWARECGAEQIAPTAPEMVHASVADTELTGIFWPAAGADSTHTAIVLVHGLTSTPFSQLLQQMAPVLAEQNVAVLAPGLRRSGWAGHESSVFENDTEDLESWVRWLEARGINRIVLAGASIGSISVGRYFSVSKPDAVIAIAHLMPTAECPDWYRQAAGAGPYEAAVAQAGTAIAEGRGETELIDIDVRQPPPSQTAGRFRWTQRAASWLSWWGPDADSRNSVHIANATVPVLLLSGTADSYNDEARFAELRAAAVNAPSVAEIWYPDIDHGLAGMERQTARDLIVWLQTEQLI